MKKPIQDLDPEVRIFAPEKDADGKKPELAEIKLTHGYVPLHAVPSPDGVFEKCEAGDTIIVPVEEAQNLVDIERAKVARVRVG